MIFNDKPMMMTVSVRLTGSNLSLVQCRSAQLFTYPAKRGGGVSFQEEIQVIEKGISILKHELRITTQRVNLFEKIKIPEAKEAIRRIKIYISDQMTNAVCRSKIAKNKIEEANFEEVAV